MTGTGTKTDPYVITTWNELTTTVVQNDIYIELGSDIDCKNEGPLTIDTGYEMNFAELNGNGHSLKNAYFLNSTTIFTGVRSNTIRNLKFKNIYMNNSGPFFLFKSDSDNSYRKLPTFKNCPFSICIDNDSIFIDNITTYLYSAVFRNCPIHIKSENSQIFRCRLPQEVRTPVLLDACCVELYGTIKYTALQAQLIDSKVTGEVTVEETNEDYYTIDINNAGISGYYTKEFLNANSVVNLKVNNETESPLWLRTLGVSYTENDTTHYCSESLFVNTEVIEDVSLSVMNTASNLCNSLQINNEAYLSNHGLIAEETYDNRYVLRQSLYGIPYEEEDENKAYIDTGVKNETGVKIESKFEYFNSVRGFAIGGYDSNGYGVAHGSGDGISIDDLRTITVNITPDYYYGFAGTKFDCYTDGSVSWGSQSEIPMIINGQNFGDLPRYGLDGKIYQIKIWDSTNTLLRDYRPAYDNISNEHGMYDLVSGTFYGSETETPFTVGDVIPFKFIDGVLTHRMEYDVEKIGAFYNATNLTEVQLPESVKSIGRFAFANTDLKKVKIASDCVYYDTSFPRDCEIEFYE